MNKRDPNNYELKKESSFKLAPLVLTEKHINILTENVNKWAPNKEMSFHELANLVDKFVNLVGKETNKRVINNNKETVFVEIVEMDEDGFFIHKYNNKAETLKNIKFEHDIVIMLESNFPGQTDVFVLHLLDFLPGSEDLFKDFKKANLTRIRL